MKTVRTLVNPLVSLVFILAVFSVYYYGAIEGWIVVHTDLIDLIPSGKDPYLFGYLIVLGLMSAWPTKEFYSLLYQRIGEFIDSTFSDGIGLPLFDKLFKYFAASMFRCVAAYFWVEVMRWGFQLLFNFILWLLGVTQTIQIEITNNLMMNWWMMIVLFVGATLSEMLDRKSKLERQTS